MLKIEYWDKKNLSVTCKISVHQKINPDIFHLYWNYFLKATTHTVDFKLTQNKMHGIGDGGNRRSQIRRSDFVCVRDCCDPR